MKSIMEKKASIILLEQKKQEELKKARKRRIYDEEGEVCIDRLIKIRDR